MLSITFLAVKTYHAAEDFSEAIKNYTKAIDLEPDVTDWYEQRS